MLPALVLKKMIMGNFTNSKVDVGIADSIDFMVERVSSTALLSFKVAFSTSCDPSFFANPSEAQGT